MSGDGIIIIMMAVLTVVLAVIMFRISDGVVKDKMRECLAHQEWCVEHYQLEEGK